MNKDIFLSYIIPCYNVQKYLPACIESLARQSIKEGAGIEYIFVNDGSNDDTLSILNAFADRDKRATVIDQANQGVCAARNNGLKFAKGKYVYFHDGDDILTDEASQLVYDVSFEKEPDIIIPYAYSVKENELDNNKEWKTFADFKPGIYSQRDFVEQITTLPISVKVYKQDIIVNNNIKFDEDLKVGEVYTFFFHVLSRSKFIALSDKHMMKWVERNEGTTRGGNIKRDIQIINTIHHIDMYADLFPFNVKSCQSYQNSLYEITTIFSFSKYFEVSNYSSDINHFLKEVRNDCVFKDTLKYFLFRNPRYGRRYLNIAVLYFFPVSFTYFKIKYSKKVRSLLKRS